MSQLKMLLISIIIILLFAGCGKLTPTLTREYIVFTSDRDGDKEIYIMGSDGMYQKNLTNHLGDDSHPALSPDQQYIAFTSDRDGTTEVYVMKVDGSEQTNLTQNPGYDYFPAWSPDGKYILFISYRDGVLSDQGKELSEVYIMDANGSNLQRLTNNLYDEGYLSWSPNGHLIALAIDIWPDVSSDNFSRDIYTMNLDGTNLTRLTEQSGDDDYPTWSPDGTLIAFMSYRNGGSEIYIMKSDGSEQKRLTVNQNIMSYNLHPSWSSDGNQIVFTARRDENYDIYVMDADGSDQIRLTDNSSLDMFPTWGLLVLNNADAE